MIGFAVPASASSSTSTSASEAVSAVSQGSPGVATVADATVGVKDGLPLAVSPAGDAESGASSSAERWQDPVDPSQVLEVAPAVADGAVLPDDVFDLREASADVIDQAVGVDPVVGSASVDMPGGDGEDVPLVEVGDEVAVSTVEVDGAIPGASVAFTLRNTDPAADASWAELVVNPDAFAGAYGADYADRLELWAFPECSLDATASVDCLNGTQLPATVDSDTGALVVEVPVDPMAGTLGGGYGYGVGGPLHLGSSRGLLASLVDARHVAMATSASGTVLAAVSGPSGPGGTFTATDLPAPGTWGASGATGAFTYSIPLELPPAVVGTAPDLSLNYLSAAVDGRNIASNGQASAAGEGWDFSTGYIERIYTACANDGYSAHASDLCWKSPDSSDPGNAAYVLNLGGASYPLIWDGGNGYRTSDDRGWRITHHSGGSADNDDNNDEYFKLALPDGSRYFFGLGTLSDGTVTNSVATVPVFGDDSGEPRCNGSAASDYCVQGYRWMLDKALDRNENAVTYLYTRETNRYALGGDASKSVSYTSAISLGEVHYGQRDSDLTNYEVKVVVGARYRCMERTGTSFYNFDDDPACPSAVASNAASYPDVPLDLKCTATCSSSQDSPTFFTTKRYDFVLVQVKKASGGWVSAYRHQLGFAFPATDDGSARSLWLNTVQTRYYTLGDTSDYANGYAYAFDGDQLNNRVDWTQSVRALDKRRITSVYTPLGGRVDVDYATSYSPGTSRHCPMGGSAGNQNFTDWYAPVVAAGWDHNSWDCYPMFFDPDGAGGAAAGFGIFHKYRVESVKTYDLVGDAPMQSVSYEYVGSPAWAYQDDPLVARGAGVQTWNDDRGYTRVIATQGAGADTAVTATQYYRGMDGDWNANGTTKDATILNLVTNADVTDYRPLRGRELSTRVRNDDGDYMSTSTTAYNRDKTVDRPGVHDAVAVTVKYVDTAERVVDSNLVPTSQWRTRRVSTSYDEADRPVEVKTDDDIDTAGDIACTEMSYATAVGDDGSWSTVYDTSVWGQKYYQWFIAETITHEGTCDAGVVSARKRYLYDGADAVTGQHPIDGNVTTERTYTDHSHTASTSATYTPAGRVLTQTSANQDGATTPATTTYSYSGIGTSPRTATVTRASASTPTFTSSATYEVAFGQPTRTQDEQGQVTYYQYDKQGRLTDGWAPRQSGNAATLDTSLSRTVHYNYSGSARFGQSRTEPARVEQVLAPDNSAMRAKQRTLTLFNGSGQPFEVHTPTADGTSGRLVTNTRYDELGRVFRQSEPYLSTTAYDMDAAPANPSSLATIGVPYSETLYDWAGRAVEVDRKNGYTYLSRTSTEYHGDRTNTISLGKNGAVGSSSTARLDSRGRTAMVLQHEGWDSTADRPTGADIVTTYTYGVNSSTGEAKTTATDAAGSATITTTDLAGRTIKLDDPNGGVTTYAYDDDGNVVSMSSPAGVIAMTYDVWDRTTKREALPKSSSTADATTTWRYDTAPNGTASLPGMLFKTAHTTPAGTVISRVDAVDDYGAVTQASTVLPSTSALGELAGTTYTASTSYDQWGRATSATLPAVGDMPAETLTTSYDAWSRPTRLASGATTFVTGETYQPDGKTDTRTYGNAASTQLTYDGAGRVATIEASLRNGTTAVQSDSYTYNDDGTLKSVWNGVTNVRQCYVYDGYVRLTQAWTQTGSCSATAPSTWNVGATAYSNTWEYGNAGRIGSTTTSTGDGTTATRTYTYTDPNHPTAVTTVTGGATGHYTYDAAGRMTSRTNPSGTGADTLTWDPLSNLATAGAETYLYDGSGQRIARIANGAATVWVGPDEITDTNTAATSGVSATRTYTFHGKTVAVRHAGDINHDGADDTGIQLIFTDLQGSAEASLNVTLINGVMQTTTTTTGAAWQAYSPYGSTRGSSNLLQSRGWLGQVEDTTNPASSTGTSTGLTYLNARYYDPTLGRFISPDPILIPGDPRTLDPYMYAGNNPIAYVDPTGLRLACASGGTLDQDACYGGKPTDEVRNAGGFNRLYNRGGSARERENTWGQENQANRDAILTHPSNQWWLNIENGAFTSATFGAVSEPILGDSAAQWLFYGTGFVLGLLGAIVELPEEGAAVAGEGAILAVDGAAEAIEAAANTADHVLPIGPGSEKAWTVLNRVDGKGSPLPGYKGGRVFENTQGKLPESPGLTYREWDVNPFVKGGNRGAERIVTGSDGSAYWTGDHYDSFLIFRGPTP
ncbi:RHS repeat-associated core domain-containing protein [Demequina soli]|uniref:RHS repeat-associated core domain-containing protein n=1 Tax=Demequina soli TaxID=1638987 RepID=UPI0012E09374|nr:RHS repeat-associated core domain-containing protein [Demequina soli]